MSKYLQTTHRDIAWFKQAHELNQLQMRPPFQRNPVWTVRQKGFLMDTILNSYPIPEIYMQDITNEKGEKNYIVVDGQQRITACLDFINDQFSIDTKDSSAYGGLSFEDLNVDQKKMIYGYQFVVRLLPDISEIEIREIFQRLNRNNVALNSQELRQATYWGPFIETMNFVADLSIWTKFDVFTSNDIKRMLDVEFVSELTIAVLHGVQNKKITLDKYYQLYEDEFPEKGFIKEVFEYVLKELISILPNIGETRWSKKTDFYTLFVLFAKNKNKLPLGDESRQQAQQVLLYFAAIVDEYVKVNKTTMIEFVGDLIYSVSGNQKVFKNNEIKSYKIESVTDEEIEQYALNLRASSDLGARRKREEVLEKALKPIFE